MTLDTNKFKGEGLQLITDGDTVVIKGDAFDPDSIKSLHDFIKKSHARMIESGNKEIRVDITKLAFLNSSGIREFADWIFIINDLPEDKRYIIQFICNPKSYSWQEVSITTLSQFNKDFIKKVDIEKPDW